MKFKYTRKALEIYDKNEPNRRMAWNKVETNEDVRNAAQADKDAIDKVRIAFHKDTKHINCLENCMITDIYFLRKCAEEDN